MSDYSWPKAAKPSPTDWNTWELTISRALNVGRQNRLPLPLGTYLHHTPKGWYFSPEETALWFASGNDWYCHGKIPSRLRTQTFHRHREIATPTQPLRRVTVRINPTTVALTGSGHIATPATMETGIKALQQLTFANEWIWILTIIGNLSNLLEDIREGHGYAVSNGSYQEGRGAAAWIIEGTTNSNQLIGQCISPSDEAGHSSFCSELAGIQAILLMIKTILLTASEAMAFWIACDGKSVLQWLQKTNITDPNKPHTDLLSSTWHLLQTSNLNVQLHHIKGHQDSRNFGPYTRDATLNIKVDRLVREKLEDYKPGPKNFHIPWS